MPIWNSKEKCYEADEVSTASDLLPLATAAREERFRHMLLVELDIMNNCLGRILDKMEG